MKKAFVLAAAVAFVLLLTSSFLWEPASAQEKPAPAASKWEYKVVTKRVLMLPQDGEEAEFNRLGDEGWELAVVSTRQKEGPAVSFVFKRAKR